MDTRPLAIGLPNWQVITNLLLFEYIWISLSLGKYLIIYKLHITYKLSALIYKPRIICKGYNSPYK